MWVLSITATKSNSSCHLLNSISIVNGRRVYQQSFGLFLAGFGKSPRILGLIPYHFLPLWLSFPSSVSSLWHNIKQAVTFQLEQTLAEFISKPFSSHSHVLRRSPVVNNTVISGVKSHKNLRDSSSLQKYSFYRHPHTVKIYAVTSSIEDVIIGLDQFPFSTDEQRQTAQDTCATITHFSSVALLPFCFIFHCNRPNTASRLRCFYSLQ